VFSTASIDQKGNNVMIARANFLSPGFQKRSKRSLFRGSSPVTCEKN